MTPNKEDYLKLILELGGGDDLVSNKEIVSNSDVTPASVSEMIGKLVKEELVTHTRYQGVQLTQKGLEKASELLRRHRLWEVFLVEKLGYQWNEVHQEAEILEHATSMELEKRLDEFLDFPKACPHGAIIPKINDIIHEPTLATLANAKENETLTIARVLDEKALLDYLVFMDIQINEQYTIKEKALFDGDITIANERHTLSISHKAAQKIFVETKKTEQEM
ncbi:iron (metal) dependent repressor, DtxR family [Pilibacter termitis]|uniref:Manganese transport regulator n=1 Tax=Pilibacter termitis TaxID=263852 RepID=A0A1T4NH34_9ENTE|nr:metal-dependent transcriptional regulator [Pilibacter termitis]SJZ78048.1 iron (metal) dependent repressor, DtxR family [Pilibacter termitis]